MPNDADILQQTPSSNVTPEEYDFLKNYVAGNMQGQAPVQPNPTVASNASPVTPEERQFLQSYLAGNNPLTPEAKHAQVQANADVYNKEQAGQPVTFTNPQTGEVKPYEIKDMDAPTQDFIDKIGINLQRGNMAPIVSISRALGTFTGNKDLSGWAKRAESMEGAEQQANPATSDNWAGKAVLGVANMAPSIAQSLAINSLTGGYGALGYWGLQGAGEIDKGLDDAGVTDNRIKIPAMVFGGAVQGILFSKGLESIFGGAKSMVGESVKQTISSVIKDYAKNLAVGEGAVTISGIVKDLSQQIGETLDAKFKGDPDYNKIDIWKVLDNAKKTAEDSLPSMLLASGLGTGVKAIRGEATGQEAPPKPFWQPGWYKGTPKIDETGKPVEPIASSSKDFPSTTDTVTAQESTASEPVKSSMTYEAKVKIAEDMGVTPQEVDATVQSMKGNTPEEKVAEFHKQYDNATPAQAQDIFVKAREQATTQERPQPSANVDEAAKSAETVKTEAKPSTVDAKSDNPYMRMEDIERVRKDADNGVVLAKEALATREGATPEQIAETAKLKDLSASKEKPSLVPQEADKATKDEYNGFLDKKSPSQQAVVTKKLGEAVEVNGDTLPRKEHVEEALNNGAKVVGTRPERTIVDKDGKVLFTEKGKDDGLGSMAMDYARHLQPKETKSVTKSTPKIETKTGAKLAQEELPKQTESTTSEKASVPAMITKKMREDLKAKGVSAEEVKNMTPQQAWDRINKIEEPRKENTVKAQDGGEVGKQSKPVSEPDVFDQVIAENKAQSAKYGDINKINKGANDGTAKETVKGTIGSNGRNLEEWNALCNKSQDRWERKFNRLVKAIDSESQKIKWRGAKFSKEYARSPEFKQAYEHFEKLGFETLPMTEREWGACTFPSEKTVIFSDCRKENDSQLFINHETVHILGKEHPDVKALMNQVDLESPVAREWERELDKHGDDLAEEISAGLIGRAPNILDAFKTPQIAKMLENKLLDIIKDKNNASEKDISRGQGSNGIVKEIGENPTSYADNKGNDGRNILRDDKVRQERQAEFPFTKDIFNLEQQTEQAKGKTFDELEKDRIEKARIAAEKGTPELPMGNKYGDINKINKGEFNETRNMGQVGRNQEDVAERGKNTSEQRGIQGRALSASRGNGGRNSLRERSMPRWERQLDSIRNEASGEGATEKDKQRLSDLKISKEFADTLEFQKAHEENAKLGYDTIPIETVGWGGVTIHDKKTVLLEDSRADGLHDYFAKHENFHVKYNNGDTDARKLARMVNLASPMAKELAKKTDKTGEALQEEIAASIIGGMEDSKQTLFKLDRALPVIEKLSEKLHEQGFPFAKDIFNLEQQTEKGKELSEDNPEIGLKDGEFKEPDEKIPFTEKGAEKEPVNPDAQRQIFADKLPFAKVDRTDAGVRVELPNGKSIDVHLKDEIPSNPKAQGAWLSKDNIIQLANRAGNAVIGHEIWHGAKDLADLSKGDLKTLANRFKGNEEAEANAYSKWNGKPSGKIEAVFQKIRNLFTDLANKLGIKTVGGVFRKVETGKAFGANEKFKLGRNLMEAMDKATQASKIYSELKNKMVPYKAGEEARIAYETLRENLGHLQRSLDKADEAMSAVKDYFTKAGKFESLEFYHRLETITDLEKAFPDDKPMQELGKAMRRITASDLKEVQGLGTGKLKDFVQNYMPHIYEKDPAVLEFLRQMGGQKPLAGSKAFLEDRTIPTLRDAMKYRVSNADGFIKSFDTRAEAKAYTDNNPNMSIAEPLKPISYNPADMVMLKHREVQKYIMGVKTIKALTDMGIGKFSASGRPDGFEEIPFALSDVYSKDAIGKDKISGKYYMHPEAAKIINNYLSPGLRGNPFYDLYRGAGNTLTQFQLSISAFHAGFVTGESITSKLAMGINQLSRGNIIEASKDVSTALTGLAPILNYIEGNKLFKAWMGVKGGSGMEAIAQYAELANAHAKMDAFYDTLATKNFQKALTEGNYIKIGLHLPFMVVEQISRPLMEHLVPRMKLGIFADHMRMEMEHNPNMTHEQGRAIAQRIWNSVDNRMGQYVYDNLAWNKTAKDLSMASVRSLGWNLGTLFEIGGGLKDYGNWIAQKTGTQQFLSKYIKGLTPTQKAEFTYRMAYVTALPIVAGMAGTMYQKISTGQSPQELKDLYFPKTGGLDKEGNPSRVALPFYMKDIYHYWVSPFKTLKNKLSPVNNIVMDMLSNKDFYNVEIRHPDDKYYQQGLEVAKYLGKQFIPFSFTNQKRDTRTGVKAFVEPFIGITPAPSDLHITKAEEKAREILNNHMPQGSKTQEQADRTTQKRNIENAYLLGDTQPLQAAKEAGLLSSTEITKMKNESKQAPLERMTKSFTVEDTYSLLKLATPAEKPLLEQIIKRKLQTLPSDLSIERKTAIRAIRDSMRR